MRPAMMAICPERPEFDVLAANSSKTVKRNEHPTPTGIDATANSSTPGRIVDIGPCGNDLDEATAKRAVEIIRCGGIIALPTDTLYGVACDARNSVAIRRLYELKGRSETKPL